MTPLVLLGLTLCGTVSPALQQIPVNGAAQGSRTGLIAGQVLDTTGPPLPDAIVRLTLPAFNPNVPTTPKGRVVTDRDGRFFFAGLPGGAYYLSASRDGYAGGT